jgi:hypothetical protein
MMLDQERPGMAIEWQFLPLLLAPVCRGCPARKGRAKAGSMH